MSDSSKPWLNGEPYYCATCGLGPGEQSACEELDCKLETKEVAETRRRITAAYDAETARTHEAMLKAREPVPKSYPARSAAWRAWRDVACADWTPRDEDIAKVSFVAGWDARKRAQYSGDPAVNHSEDEG